VATTETYSFGEWLKRRREALRLTQRALAAAAHCSVPMLKKIEGDERRPSPELARLLAGALRVPVEQHAAFVAAARGERAVDALWPIQADADAADWQAYDPSPLPPAATTFIGRVNELGEIAERLAQADCRLLTLVGPGGIGKTRLALQAAEAYGADTQPSEGEFAQPAVFVPLASVSAAAAIPEAVARALRLNLSGPPEALVISFLRRRRMLLILDNCEQVTGDLAWLGELLGHAPGVKLLTTSRERLHLAEEHVYAVPGLAEARALFVERARRVAQDFDEQAERPNIARICGLVENLPLAVELAAGWTPLMSCAQIAEHLKRDLGLLATDVRNVPERHRSLQTVFDYSWRLLTETEQQALMRLSVFRGGWLAEEGQAVARANLHLLRRLVDTSMVRAGKGGRFDLHESIRQYAAWRLAEAGLQAETQRRHFDAYRALATRLYPKQFGPGAMAGVAAFDQEQPNIRAALAWGLENREMEGVFGLLYHMWFYWSRRGAYQEGSEWLR
jgi:predicted ATPase/DNA-binding XRE family transcriptional regulator